MWALMMTGPRPFQLSSTGVLQLSFAPIIPGWLFSMDTKTVSFTFLGSIEVTYSNPLLADTWTLTPSSIRVTDKMGHTELIPGSVLEESYALKVREKQVQSIFVQF
jgi:hypothetical protein